MLDDKLEKAKKEIARRKGRLVMRILSVLVIPPVLWFSFIGLKTFLVSSASPPGPVQKPASHDETSPLKTAVKNGHDQLVSDKARRPDTEKQDLHEQFKLIYSQYENEVAPELSQGETWMPEKRLEINRLKEKSLRFFSSGQYTEAITGIEQAKKLAASLITERENAFKDQVNKARDSLENDQAEQAGFYIEKALQIKPGQPDALALLNEIDKLEQIIPLLTGVKAARAEKNFSKEYKLLGQIQTIAPGRYGIAQRRAELESLIKQQAFAHHIDKGFEAVDTADPGLAAKHYKQANAIEPGRRELALLAERIAILERELRISATLKKADQAIRRDDWQGALHAYLSALKDAPGDQTVQVGLRRAEKITGLEKAFKTLLADPYQLSDPAAKNRAEKLLQQARPMGQFSFSLQLKSRELAEKMAIMQQPVTVTVISDEKTYVRVIGVGNVGHVTEKNIRLKPGRYTFEGQRNGYVSKRVKALIPYDKETLPVTVICDQSI